MSLLGRLVDGPRAPRAEGLDPLDDRYYPAGPGGAALTGVYVSPETAMNISAVWACVRVLSDPIGWLPLMMYRRQADGGRQRADFHPLFGLLHDQPNAWQTAQDWRKMMTVHVLLRGRGLSRILPGPRGAVDQLIPIHPDRLVKVDQASDYTLRYTVRKIGSLTENEVLVQSEVFDLRGLSFDGINCVSAVEYGRQTLGLGMATESFAARFFSQNATPSGLLVHPGVQDRKQRENIRAEWEAAMSGLNNAHRTAVLSGNVDYKPISVSNLDSQFLETREFGVQEIARWFGVPLHKIQQNTKSSSWGSGIEELNLDFITQALLPLMTAWQQAISRDLIIDTRNYYAEFLLDALAKGKLIERYTAFHLALNDGWMNRNEVRAIENRNRADGLDEYLRQANTLPGDIAGQGQLPGGAGPGGGQALTDGNQASGQPAHYRLLVADAAGRVVRKEIAAMTKAAKRCDSDEREWLVAIEQFYSDKHADYVREALPMLDAESIEHYLAEQGSMLIEHGPDVMQGWVPMRVEHLVAVAMDEVSNV